MLWNGVVYPTCETISENLHIILFDIFKMLETIWEIFLRIISFIYDFLYRIFLRNSMCFIIYSDTSTCKLERKKLCFPNSNTKGNDWEHLKKDKGDFFPYEKWLFLYSIREFSGIQLAKPKLMKIKLRKTTTYSGLTEQVNTWYL